MSSFRLLKKTFSLIIQSVLVLAVTGGAGAVWAATPTVSAGGGHSLVLHSDGTLWATGLNQTGQLGDGSSINRSTPVQVAAGNWARVSAGVNHSLAVKADGSLWGWGANQFGQVGDGTTVEKPAPVRIGTANDWVSVAAGGFSSFALKADGTLWAWGDNAAGVLGINNEQNQSVPVQVLNNGASKYVSVSSGGEHTLALQADGTLWSWGFNLHGQLGDGTVEDSLIPLQVGTGTSWKAISAGGVHSVALKADGTLWSWGGNDRGQLGIGATDLVAHSAPVQVGSASDWVAISAGELHTLALRRNGAVSAWGFNQSGQLGDGTVVNKSAPTAITNPIQFSNIVAISTGGTHSTALLANGDIYAWGNNAVGQFGVGTVTPSTSPVLAGEDSVSWTKSEPGNAFTVALRSNGTLWAWGDNAIGQLGDGSLVTRNIPVAVAGAASNWLTSASGLSHTIAIRANGTLWAWGDNGSGQLGDAAIVGSATTPQLIGVSNTWSAVAAGDLHSLALKADGTLWAWGDNAAGQLGIGSADPGRALPTQVVTANPGSFDRNWVAIAAGGTHSLGLQADGTLWAWGDNSSGQLGDSTIAASINAPSQIVDLSSGIPGFNSSWVAVAAGLGHSLALQADGTLWAWGSNFTGQLGNGDVTAPNPPNRLSPVAVINTGGAPYVGVAAGDSFSTARRADGSLWSWGSNTAGQLGIGSTDPDPGAPVSHSTPLREVTLANDWAAVAVGGQHVVAIKAAGILDAWGDNTSGQLGDGTFAAKNSPSPLLESIINVPATIAFGTAAVSVLPSPTRPLLIANTGSGVLTVNSIVPGGADSGMFTLDLTACGGTTPFNLAAGTSCTATVTFIPTTAGLKTATLTINSNAPLSPVVTVNLSGTAVLPFIINASSTSPVGSGTITPTGAVPVAPGGNQTFVFTPNPGFSVQNVNVDGIAQGPSASYTFNNVQATHTIAVSFTSTLTITATAGAGGTMSPIGTVPINAGDNKTFIITPDFGYAIGNVAVTEMVEVLVNGVWNGNYAPVTTNLGPVTTFTFNNVMVNGSSITASFVATNIRTWNWRNPLPQGLAVRSVDTDGLGNYAAVGDFGIIMTSSNGVDWTVRQSGTMNLNGVAFGNGKYVAVGNGGRIVLSTDGGATWNEKSSGTASHLNCVTYNGTVFVAVGNSQLAENYPYVPRITVLTSLDGVVWTDRSPLLAINETLDLYDIAAGANGKLAAVGAGGVIFTSADNGITWTRIPDDLANRAGSINSISYGNSTFVAVGDFGQVTVSFDNGVTWNPISVFSVADLQGVAFGTIGDIGNTQSLFVAVGSDGEVLTSENLGVNWTTRFTGLANSGGGPVLNTIVFGLNKSVVPAGVPQLLVAGDMGVILTSPDSVLWTSQLKSVSNATLKAVARGNGSFAAVGGEPATLTGPARAAVVTSLDNGITWTNRNLPAGIQNLTAIAYGNGIFVAVGRSSYNASVNTTGEATILTSADGINWVSRISGSFLGLNGIVFANGKFTAVGDYNQSGGPLPEGAAILTSVNGISWTFVQKITETGWPLTSIAFGNNRYVAAGELGGVLVSPDGIAWTEVISPIINGYDITSIAYGSGVFRAVGSGTEAFVSSDNGFNWVSEVLPVPATLNNKFQGIAHFNGQFVAVGNDDFIISKDSDVAKWVVNTGAEFVNSTLYGIAVGNGTFVAVGANGTILQSKQLVPDAPQIVLNPTLFTVSNGLVGATYKQTITITNKGLANLVIGSITAPVAPFSKSNDTCSTATLPVLESCTLDVTYAPSAVGVSNSSLIIPSNTEGGLPVTFPLSGTAVASFAVTLTTAGAGTGTVTAAPAGYPTLNCVSGSTANCTAFYAANTLVSLIATPNDWKQPGTFSGACTGTGNCTTTMDANKAVTATFATALKVRNSAGTTLDHPAIQDAYAVAASGATIRAQNYLFLESLLFNRAIPVTLSGGWNSTYTSNTGGYATVTGSVTISSGSVVIDKLIIK